MTKEEIYDQQIAPLMDKIIAIAQEHDIPMLATFDLDEDRSDKDRPGRMCTTCIRPPGVSRKIAQALAIIMGDSR